MRTGRALLACLDVGGAAAMARLLAAEGYEIIARAASVPEAAEAVRREQPDLLAADAILPGGDGESLLARALTPGLNRYPDAILLVPQGLQLPNAAHLTALGAVLMEKPPTPEGLRRALWALGENPGFLPPEKAEALTRMLNHVGIPPHPGREMLARAAALAWRDRRRLDNLRDAVYPEAARPFGKTPAQAERAIRHVIDAAWRRGDMDAQHRIFGDTIDARRGRPTCGEMIAQLADLLRWEG